MTVRPTVDGVDEPRRLAAVNAGGRVDAVSPLDLDRTGQLGGAAGSAPA